MSVPCLGILTSVLLFFRAKLANTAKSRRSVGPSVTSVVNNLENLGEQGWESKDDEAFKRNRLTPCLQRGKKKEEIICFD